MDWIAKASLSAVLAMLMANPNFPAQASAPSESQERQIAVCIKAASHGVVWLEQTLWGLRDQEAGWIGAEVLNTNGSHDLGPFQINSWWVPKIAKALGRGQREVRHWLKFDPCFNAHAARWIFTSQLGEARGYWDAVGAYHSPTPWRQRRYSRSVADHLGRRFGTTVFRSVQRGQSENFNSPLGSGKGREM
ncbi:lytic transglycosylase domain-containing protein [Sphingobium sp. AN558]|uniref:lytic transglycosylase domain-containing protein n=1 Tax=Sphingobium sp. AN558 TaxID=3133442 RepID=UPI0030C6253C